MKTALATLALLVLTPVLAHADGLPFSSTSTAGQANASEFFTLGSTGNRFDFGSTGSSSTGSAIATSGYSNLKTDFTFTTNVTPISPAPTPEPSTLALLGTGVLGIAGMLRRRKPAAA